MNLLISKLLFRKPLVEVDIYQNYIYGDEFDNYICITFKDYDDVERYIHIHNIDLDEYSLYDVETLGYLILNELNEYDYLKNTYNIENCKKIAKEIITLYQYLGVNNSSDINDFLPTLQ